MSLSKLKALFSSDPSQKEKHRALSADNVKGVDDSTSTQNSDDDDNWSDTSCDDDLAQEDDANVKKPKAENRYVPPMPALLGRGLPPCGTFPQTSYEIVNTRLRNLWLECAQGDQVNRNLVSICTIFQAQVNLEAAKRRAAEASSSRGKVPNYGNYLLSYQLKWAQYFLRESQVLLERESMTVAQLQEQDFEECTQAIPKELHIPVQNAHHRKQIFKMWRKWHQKKRAEKRQAVVDDPLRQYPRITMAEETLPRRPVLAKRKIIEVHRESSSDSFDG